jgi:hypothetical protein
MTKESTQAVPKVKLENVVAAKPKLQASAHFYMRHHEARFKAALDAALEAEKTKPEDSQRKAIAVRNEVARQELSRESDEFKTELEAARRQEHEDAKADREARIEALETDKPTEDELIMCVILFCHMFPRLMIGRRSESVGALMTTNAKEIVRLMGEGWGVTILAFGPRAGGAPDDIVLKRCGSASVINCSRRLISCTAFILDPSTVSQFPRLILTHGTRSKLLLFFKDKPCALPVRPFPPTIWACSDVRRHEERC